MTNQTQNVLILKSWDAANPERNTHEILPLSEILEIYPGYKFLEEILAAPDFRTLDYIIDTHEVSFMYYSREAISPCVGWDIQPPEPPEPISEAEAAMINEEFIIPF